MVMIGRCVMCGISAEVVEYPFWGNICRQCAAYQGYLERSDDDDEGPD